MLRARKHQLLMERRSLGLPPLNVTTPQPATAPVAATPMETPNDSVIMEMDHTPAPIDTPMMRSSDAALAEQITPAPADSITTVEESPSLEMPAKRLKLESEDVNTQ